MNAVRVLKKLRDKFGYLPRRRLERLAHNSGVSIGELHGVASFYQGLRLTPPDAVVEIGVCRDMTCFLNGAPEFHRCLARDLDLQIRTGKVVLGQVSCLGLCNRAREGLPVFTVDDVAHWGIEAAEFQRDILCEPFDRLAKEPSDDQRRA